MKKTEQRTSDEQIAFITSEVADDPNFADFVENIIFARKSEHPFNSASLEDGIRWFECWLEHCRAIRTWSGSGDLAKLKEAASGCHLRMIIDLGVFFQITKEIGDARASAINSKEGNP